MAHCAALVSDVEEKGFVLVRHAAGEALVDAMQQAVAAIATQTKEVIPSARAKKSDYGIRGLLAKSSRLRELAATPALLDLACAVLGPDARPVKGIFFDKNPGANWLVPWHQDLTVTVQERREAAGFGPWSEKDGLLHVQPPAETMARILALRVHLDDAGAENGALRVLPGTHCRGRLSGKDIAQCAREVAPVACGAARGDVLVIWPLLVHASSPSRVPSHRRVLHLEYSAVALPNGLQWGG